MHVHRIHPLRRHNDPMPQKLTRSLIFFLSALLFATAVFGFLRDAEAQFSAYSLPNGAGGWNYYQTPGTYGDRSGGMLNLGIQMMQMGNDAEMQRQWAAHQQELQRRQWAEQHRAQRRRLDWQSQETEKFRQLQETHVSRGTWTPEKARASWGMDQ